MFTADGRGGKKASAGGGEEAADDARRANGRTGGRLTIGEMSDFDRRVSERIPIDGWSVLFRLTDNRTDYELRAYRPMTNAGCSAHLAFDMVRRISLPARAIGTAREIGSFPDPAKPGFRRTVKAPPPHGKSAPAA